MNERIKDFIKQATLIMEVKHEGYRGKSYTEQVKVFDKEKFAELIVEEMYCFMCDATDNDKPWPSFKEVKQHFGVEE